MKFDNSFFEDEVRCGFYVPSIIKRAWAAQLEVFEVFNNICSENNIKYFAAYGTLLGAVRHKGFVPWDDDIDVIMKRADYEKLLSVADKLPYGFKLINHKNHPQFWHFMKRLVGKTNICFEKKHLKRFHDFPYITGIDIFIYDYVSRDDNKEALRERSIEYILAIADNLDTYSYSPEKLKEGFDMIEHLSGLNINRSLSGNDLKIQLYSIAERLIGQFSEAEADDMTLVMPLSLYGGTYRISKKVFEKTISLPFENMNISAPAMYDTYLKSHYDDYMTVVKAGSSHDYPCFAAQEAQMEDLLAQNGLNDYFPKFTYRADSQEKSIYKEKSYKAEALALFCRLETLSQDILDLLKNKTKINEVNEFFVLLENAQNTAISLGNLLEENNNFNIVPFLEEFCERVFNIYNEINAGCLYTPGNNTDLISCISNIKNKINELSEQKEVVFVAFKGKYWDSFKQIYEKKKAEVSTNIYVITAPTIYKHLDGELEQHIEDTSAFPSGLPLISYSDYDFEKRCPDEIYIQNPYDEFNPAFTMPACLYSSVLKHFCKKLIYIPFFTVDEFSPGDSREYYNMKYYCTMPGVVNADKVIVQSENMRDTYIQKLTEFAGKNSRKIWEEKITTRP